MASLEYLAGIIDIKAGFYVRRKVTKLKRGSRISYGLQLTVATTHKPIVDALKESLGGHVTNKGNESARSRMCWEWKVSDRAARDIARLMLPMLVARKTQCALFADFPFAEASIRGRNHSSANLLTPEQKLLSHKTYLKMRRLNVPCFRRAICTSE